MAELDQQLLLFINSHNSPFWDQVMHNISGKLIWAPIYFIIVAYLALRYKRKFFVIVVFIILSVFLADQVSVQLFKNIFMRLRPCHEPGLQGMLHLFNDYCGGQYGFVSSHASNSFNIAFLTLLFIKKQWYTICIICWALIIGYSRIYLGVHYPGDVIGGALLGAFIGWSCYRLYILTNDKILKNSSYFTGSTPPLTILSEK
jgi:undecaprenyl-diphosphatase